MIEEAIYAKLANDPLVRPLITTANVVRCYRMAARQDAAMPYIVMQRIDTASVQNTTGLSGLARARVQIDCYATKPAAVWDLAEKVKLSLMKDGWAVGLHTVQGVTHLDTRELPVGPFDGRGEPIYRVMQDYGIWFGEEVPA